MASEKETLGANLIEKKYVSNEIIIREGDDGDEFFLIKEVCTVFYKGPMTEPNIKYQPSNRLHIHSCVWHLGHMRRFKDRPSHSGA